MNSLPASKKWDKSLMTSAAMAGLANRNHSTSGKTKMKKLVEYPLKDGSLVLVEVEEPDRPGGPPLRGLPHPPYEVIERATQTFDDALDKIKPAAAAIIAKLKELKTPPEQI